jgi:hypothetical protein
MKEGAATQLPNRHVKSISFKNQACSCSRQLQPESFCKKNSEFGCEMKTSHRFDCAIGVVVGGQKTFQCLKEFDLTILHQIQNLKGR